MNKRMWIVWFIALAAMGGVALAMEVPAVTAQDFSGGGALASPIWAILAGEGVWGAVLLAIVGVVWKFTKPYLDEWVAARRLEKLYAAVQSGVAGCKALFTDEMKKANSDGKLTAEEVAYIRQQCRAYVLSYMASQGVDALKLYGPQVIDMLCEWMLARMKNEAVARVAGAVMPPLPDLAS